MIRKFYEADCGTDRFRGGNMPNKEQEAQASVATKAEQSSTSLPQNPDNWREEDDVAKAAAAIMGQANLNEGLSWSTALRWATEIAQPRDEEIERLREESELSKKIIESKMGVIQSKNSVIEDLEQRIQSLEAQNNK
jgi:hypothetical protein